MMNKSRRLRPSPAMVVASVALLVALGGTGYAAVGLPANSVGATQLKASAVTNSKIASNAVTSSKVKDHSLLRSDFQSGQIPAGPPGPPGAPGSAGAAGAQGVPGQQGPAGPSAAYSRSVSGPISITDTLTTLASLTIPQPGSYVVWAKGYATGTSDLDVTCKLVAGTDSDTTKVHAVHIAQSVSAIVAHQYTTSGTADFQCVSPDSNQETMNAMRIVAIQTGSLVTG